MSFVRRRPLREGEKCADEVKARAAAPPGPRRDKDGEEEREGGHFYLESG